MVYLPQCIKSETKGAIMGLSKESAINIPHRLIFSSGMPYHLRGVSWQLELATQKDVPMFS